MVYGILISLILNLVAFVMVILSSFIIYPYGLEYFTGAFFLIGTLLLLFFADLPLLALSRSSISNATRLNNLIKNLTCLIGIGEVRLFISPKFKNNVYVLHPLLRTPVIIVGENIAKNLSDKEIEILIYEILKNFKNSNIKIRTVSLIFVIPWLLPLLILTKNKFLNFGLIHVLWLMYFIPLEAVLRFARIAIFTNKFNIGHHNFITKQNFDNKPFQVVLFRELSVVNFQDYNIWDSIFSGRRKLQNFNQG